MKDFVEELKWRGMVHDIMPGTQDELNKGMTAAYIGFDPTADSLHIGNMVQIMTLVHFQRCGHKPLALVGGATGMVGDPSGKSSERNLLDEETLNHNLSCVKAQLENFLSFEGENAAEVVNNYDWFKDFNFLEFIRDVGKHITVNYMMAKDSVKSRLETGLSFTEFSYQLVQGYDFYYLWKHKGAKLQLGGSDQWGNIVTGTELIRRKEQGEAFAMTTPLITKADGSKFGKSEGGNIWLDAEKTSPYKFYQYWINSSDEDVEKYIKIFSLKERKEIEGLIGEHKEAPHQRLLQRTLAEELTERVHSKTDLDTAIKASSILFGKSTTEDLESLDEKTLLQVFEGVPQTEVSKAALGSDATTFLSETTQNIIFKSKGEARKMIQGGGVSINKTKVTAPDQSVDFSLLQDKYLLAQRGKKNYYLIKVV
ncbi:tyrosyl-tRNA synthetase [Ekhidna lutea]|uniref:Tyrosine--tRNA ligase n=1 Tax=Ekhidna lutea TaxID=447679 RepID=A0A239H2Y8_EKHLU|nr:tyrosine--tRNA ligase [Ekhidna lutea]SNS75846.1 tyrosyl-tRNA synthetase [Ekhidna lutea]